DHRHRARGLGRSDLIDHKAARRILMIFPTSPPSSAVWIVAGLTLDHAAASTVVTRPIGGHGPERISIAKIEGRLVERVVLHRAADQQTIAAELLAQRARGAGRIAVAVALRFGFGFAITVPVAVAIPIAGLARRGLASLGLSGRVTADR